MLKFSGQSRSSEVVDRNIIQCILPTLTVSNALKIQWILLGAATNIAKLNCQQDNVSCYFIELIVDPQANVAPGIPEAAICVQVIAAQYILQFAIVIALCCALHRFASRVIHRSEWLFKFYYFEILQYNIIENILQKYNSYWGDNVSVDKVLSAPRYQGSLTSVLTNAGNRAPQ